MKLIGISGKMGSGKTTLVKEIQKMYPNVKLLKFADSLYELQDLIYDKLDFTLEGEKDRDLLIRIGQWARNIDPDVFAKMGLKNVPKNFKSDLVFLFDDVRFENEANLLQERGGTLIRIDGVQRGDNVNPEYANNPSECALDEYKFKYRVDNSGTLEETTEQLKEILKKI